MRVSIQLQPMSESLHRHNHWLMSVVRLAVLVRRTLRLLG